MFYFLSKAIDFLVMPLTIFLVLSFYAFSLKNYKRKKYLLIIAFSWLILNSNSFLVNKAFNWWEYKFTNIDDLNETYDVGIVLSGGMISVPFLNADHPILGIHADRFSEAFLLYKAGKIKKILITGISQDHVMGVGRGETSQASKLLTMWGVNPEDIVFEEKSRNTRENALFSAKILNSKFPNSKYILITSAFHMRRSLGCFEKAGITVTPFPADFYGGVLPLKFKTLFVPNPDDLAYADLLWHELLGFVMYKIVGYS